MEIQGASIQFFGDYTKRDLQIYRKVLKVNISNKVVRKQVSFQDHKKENLPKFSGRLI